MEILLTISVLLIILILTYILRKKYIIDNDLPNIFLYTVSLIITIVSLLLFISVIFLCNGLAKEIIKYI